MGKMGEPSVARLADNRRGASQACLAEGKALEGVGIGFARLGMQAAATMAMVGDGVSRKWNSADQTWGSEEGGVRWAYVWLTPDSDEERWGIVEAEFIALLEQCHARDSLTVDQEMTSCWVKGEEPQISGRREMRLQDQDVIE